jgi:phosphoglycolate phosphatase-like HAD superfamily hydrolase
MSNKTIQYLLWDIDGTIFNSDELYFAYLKKELAALGFDLTEEYYGQNGLDDSILTFGLTEEQISTIKTSINQEYYSDALLPQLRFKKNFPQILADLKPHFKFAVASGERKEQIEKYLKHFNISNSFDAIGHGALVPRRKSNPAYFDLLCKELGVSKEEVLCIGDSPSDSKIAAFSIPTIIIPSCFTRHASFYPEAKILDDSSKLVDYLLHL